MKLKRLKQILRLGTLVLGISIFASSCDSEVRFTPVGAWNEDGTRILLFETRFIMPASGNTGDVQSLEVVLHAIDADKFKTLEGIRSQADYMKALDSAGEELTRYEITRDSAYYERNGAYWFQNEQLVLFRMYQDVSLYNAETKTTKILYPPSGVLEGLINTPDYPDAAEKIKTRNFSPSPDGKTIAVLQEAAYFVAGPYDGLGVKQVISYYNAEQGPDYGKHMGSYLVRLSDEEHSSIVPYLNHPLQDLNYSQYLWLDQLFLWKQDSSGVYFITEEKSIEIGTDGSVADAPLVPEKGVPTKGGRISDAGNYLERVPDSPLERDDFRLVIKPLDVWIPYAELKLIDVSEADYIVR